MIEAEMWYSRRSYVEQKRGIDVVNSVCVFEAYTSLFHRFSR